MKAPNQSITYIQEINTSRKCLKCWFQITNFHNVKLTRRVTFWIGCRLLLFWVLLTFFFWFFVIYLQVLKVTKILPKNAKCTVFITMMLLFNYLHEGKKPCSGHTAKEPQIVALSNVISKDHYIHRKGHFFLKMKYFKVSLLKEFSVKFWFSTGIYFQIGRAHVWTPVTL